MGKGQIPLRFQNNPMHDDICILQDSILSGREVSQIVPVIINIEIGGMRIYLQNTHSVYIQCWLYLDGNCLLSITNETSNV